MNPAAARQAAPSPFGEVVELLGGEKVLKQEIGTSIEVHDLLMQGLPGEALTHLVDGFVTLKDARSVEKAVGMSLRTFHRRKGTPERSLSTEQSGRTWKFAKILAKASSVFGSRVQAEDWMQRPALGLDQRRPIDLLTTPAGVDLVEDYLERIEYGVYT